VGQVLAFPPASAAPGFERAAAAFVAVERWAAERDLAPTPLAEAA